MQQFQHLYDNYLIRPANSIVHNPFREHFLSDFFQRIFSLGAPIDVQDDFLELYPKWIASSKLNSFTGLENFPNRYVSVGVTQAIDDFVIWTLKNKKRLRTLKGEYGYVYEVSPDVEITRVDDLPLAHGDALIISCPFSSFGDIHPRWQEIIDTCNTLDIPVFVDCAFFGTCIDITVDFSDPCFDTVAFSPTKGLNCGNFRTGIAFSKRQGIDCFLDVLSKWHHGVHLHTAMAYELMKNYSPDTIPLIYQQAQHAVCEHYGLTPTKTMHLALGDEQWSHFNRETVANRVGLKFAIYDYFNTGTVK